MTKNEENFPHSLFSYDPETGFVMRNGKRVGYLNGRGYREVCGNYIKVMEHRLAWRLYHGDWPTKEIDHINRCRADNRICNLRHASRFENGSNRKLNSNNKSGVSGVSVESGGGAWLIQIKHMGVLFSYRTPSKRSAMLAAPLIRRVLHGEFAS